MPTFDLVVRDAGANILGSWQGLDAGGSESYSFSFQSLVGQVLSFSLSHDSRAVSGAAVLAAGAGHTLDNAAWLDGTISVTAVPEPAAYALFLVGLAAIGLFVRRRQQR
ncbi:MAG: PEP-CTERM sorting domain-containing protein [Rubrivivax sp.]|nr:PEP-CTERM sorting domain-containing protein [Rubrivivax sp.]